MMEGQRESLTATSSGRLKRPESSVRALIDSNGQFFDHAAYTEVGTNSPAQLSGLPGQCALSCFGFVSDGTPI